MSRGFAVPTLVAAIVIIIVGLLLIVIFLGPSGSLNKAVEKSYTISDKLLIVNKDIGRIEIQQPSKDVKDGFDSVIKALNTKSDKPCIAQYKLPDKMDGFTFEFLKQENGWLAKLKNPEKQVTHFEKVENELCVVAGALEEKTQIKDSGIVIAEVKEGKVSPTNKNAFSNAKSTLGFDDDALKIAASNFYYNWIADIEKKSNIALFYLNARNIPQRILSPDYTNPTFVAVTSKTTMEYAYPNDKENRKAGKEDGGLLYVPEKGRVCVFGTKRDAGGGCDIEDGLLEQDCFDQREDRFFSSKDMIYEVTKC